MKLTFSTEDLWRNANLIALGSQTRLFLFVTCFDVPELLEPGPGDQIRACGVLFRAVAPEGSTLERLICIRGGDPTNPEWFQCWLLELPPTAGRLLRAVDLVKLRMRIEIPATPPWWLNRSILDSVIPPPFVPAPRPELDPRCR